LLKHESHYWKVGFVALVVAGSVHLFFIPLFFFMELPVLAAANVVSVAVYLFAIFGLGERTLMTQDDRAIGWLVYTELIFHAILATYYLGLESGFYYYVYILAILPFFTKRYALITQIIRLAGIIAVSLFLNIYFRDHQPLLGRMREYALMFGNINLTLFLLILGGLVILYSRHEQEHYTTLLNRSLADPLTGLYNRLFIVEYSEKFFANKTIHTVSPALIVIDIDHFKSINDTYGHTFGDLVIQRAGEHIKEYVGTHAHLSRWGGEEFVVLIPDTTRDSLEKLCKKIIEGFRNERISNGIDSVYITLTCGAALRNDAENFSELFIKADNALYEGKQAGRDRYVIAT